MLHMLGSALAALPVLYLIAHAILRVLAGPGPAGEPISTHRSESSWDE